MSIAIPSAILAAFTAFVVNEDNDHFFKLASSWMNREGLVRYAKEVLQGRVTHFSMCVNGQRTSYDSKTWEPIWKGMDEIARHDTATSSDGTHDRWAVNAKKLFDAGIDPYEVWIAECHKCGVEAWVSMRMNDVHFSTVTNFFRNTTFCKSRRDLWVDQDPKDCFGHALDYTKREVRDYNFAQVREMLWRWDADGIEVDWMRGPPFFRDGEARRNAHLLTDFMREVRAEAGRVTAKRGRKMKVIARVGFDVEKSLDVGLDVRQWLKEGLVDAIVPSNVFFPDPTIPANEWLALVRENAPSVQVFPCVNCHHHKTVESIRKAAAPHDGTAVSGIYLFNAPYVGKRDTDGRTFSEDVFGILCREGVSFPSDEFTLSAEVDCSALTGDELKQRRQK